MTAEIHADEDVGSPILDSITSSTRQIIFSTTPATTQRIILNGFVPLTTTERITGHRHHWWTRP
eukprot:2768955-Pyramimonas_sp.AAC.1